jgi:hypothetical protein
MEWIGPDGTRGEKRVEARGSVLEWRTVSNDVREGGGDVKGGGNGPENFSEA